MQYARYTVVLNELLKDTEVKAKIDKALSSYPLYEKHSSQEFIPSYIPTREELNNKILNHYKYREIGFETIARFVDELEISMNEIMPYYNQLFFSADQDYNILANVDYKRTIQADKTNEHETNMTGSNTIDATLTSSNTNDVETTTDKTYGTGGTTTTAVNGTKTDKTVSSQTPQNEINTPASNIENISYADSVQWNKGTDDTTTTVTVEQTETDSGTVTQNTKDTGLQKNEEEHTSINTASGSSKGNELTIESTKGNFGVMATQDLIKKYRETIINIEQQIINDKRIAELFMLVW